MKKPARNSTPQSLTHTSMEVSYRSPLPPPGIIRAFEDILPGAADRLFVMVEKQENHRQGLEKHVVESDTRSSLIGQIFGLIIGLAAIAGGTICILQGHEISGSFLGGSGLSSLIGVFVYGSRQRRAEREKKARENPEQ